MICVIIGNHLLPYSLTSFAVPLFTFLRAERVINYNLGLGIVGQVRVSIVRVGFSSRVRVSVMGRVY